MVDDPHLSYRSEGRIGAERLVALVRSGAVALDDPGPVDTAARDIRVLFVRMSELDADDPESFGGETPDEEHSAALVALLRQEGASDEAPVGLIGVGEVGWRAITAAVMLGEAVDRLALVGVPVPESPLDRHDAERLLGDVTAKTLIVNGQRDPGAAAAAATWTKKARGEARVEMVPGDGALALADVWARVLSHTAPRTKAG